MPRNAVPFPSLHLTAAEQPSGLPSREATPMECEANALPQTSRSLPAMIQRGEIAAVLGAANDVISLKDLYDQVGAMEVLAKRMQAAVDDENRIAEGRIRIARKLGELLHNTVQRGGLGSKSHGATLIRGGSSSPLPTQITKSMSSRLQKLAAIPEAEVERYFAHKRERGEVISMKELLGRATRSAESRQGLRLGARRERTTRSKTRPPPAMPAGRLQAVVDTVAALEDVTVCVGMPVPEVWRSARELPITAPEKDLRGVVFSVVPPGEEKFWLLRLDGARRAMRVSHAFALLPASTDATWFQGLRGWSCAFFSGDDGSANAQLLAYHGNKRRGFVLALGRRAVVMEAAEAQ